MPADTLVLRRVTPADWPALKALRLAALEETPIAYCERWADAVAAPDDLWQARAARGAVGGDSFQLLAWDADRPVATAVGFLRDGVAWLAAVHVTPDLRGQGLLERLVGGVVGWAREQDVPELRLEVHEANARARAAYRRVGFVENGRSQPYPLDQNAIELEMALPLPR